jgi:hypothetical protein
MRSVRRHLEAHVLPREVKFVRQNPGDCGASSLANVACVRESHPITIRRDWDATVDRVRYNGRRFTTFAAPGRRSVNAHEQSAASQMLETRPPKLITNSVSHSCMRLFIKVVSKRWSDHP